VGDVLDGFPGILLGAIQSRLLQPSRQVLHDLVMCLDSAFLARLDVLQHMI